MKLRQQVLYVFAGEQAQGAEVVIERMMASNLAAVQPHLFASPGKFANKLLNDDKPYAITLLPQLKKLNRSSANGISFYLKAIYNYITVSYKVYRYISRHQIKFVHANTVVPASYIIPLILFSKVIRREIQWLWSDHDLKNYSYLDTKLSKICAKLYNYTLVVSNAVKAKYTADSKKVIVLYNGLDVNLFKPDTASRNSFRSQLSIGNDTIVLGMPAVVHPRKGQLDLIKAFSNIINDYPNLCLLLSGGFESATPEYSTLVKQAIAQQRKVHHLGYVNNMVQFYNGCDIVVNNSDLLGSEPLGTTIYEAMSCEKVVVASATGGTTEIITHNVDGLLFEPNNIESLTATLKYAIEKYHLLNPLMKQARVKVKSKFYIDTMVSSYNKILGL